MPHCPTQQHGNLAGWRFGAEVCTAIVGFGLLVGMGIGTVGGCSSSGASDPNAFGPDVVGISLSQQEESGGFRHELWDRTHVASIVTGRFERISLHVWTKEQPNFVLDGLIFVDTLLPALESITRLREISDVVSDPLPTLHPHLLASCDGFYNDILEPSVRNENVLGLTPALSPGVQLGDSLLFSFVAVNTIFHHAGEIYEFDGVNWAYPHVALHELGHQVGGLSHVHDTPGYHVTQGEEGYEDCVMHFYQTDAHTLDYEDWQSLFRHGEFCHYDDSYTNCTTCNCSFLIHYARLYHPDTTCDITSMCWRGWKAEHQIQETDTGEDHAAQ